MSITTTNSTYVYTKEMLLAEHEIAAKLAKLFKFQKRIRPIAPITTGLSHKQPQAVYNACNYPISVVCGPPGTGKTTTLQRVVDSFQEAGLTGVIFGPTGKASKRADEVVNFSGEHPRKVRVDCTTVHRGLKFSYQTGGFTFNYFNPLEADYLILDEFPMADAILFRDMIMSVAYGTRIVLCGDPHQLPSVGPGNIGRDIINSKCIPAVELDHIFRTGKNSGIAFNASRILRGESVVATDPRTGEKFEDFYFVPRETEQESIDFILKSITESIPKKYNLDPIKDISIASPGKKSLAGVNNLNKEIRKILNPTAKSASIQPGDKVVYRNNDRILGLVNGDTGVVQDIQDGKIVVDFGIGAGYDPNSGIVKVPEDKWGNMHHSFCTTVHVLQGSETPCIITPLHQCHYSLLIRNLIFTAMTRAKKIAVFVGDPKALTRAINNNSPEMRYTGLCSLIKKYFKEAKIEVVASTDIPLASN